MEHVCMVLHAVLLLLVVCWMIMAMARCLAAMIVAPLWGATGEFIEEIFDDDDND